MQRNQVCADRLQHAVAAAGSLGTTHVHARKIL
jgi:hypothetical protein